MLVAEMYRPPGCDCVVVHLGAVAIGVTRQSVVRPVVVRSELASGWSVVRWPLVVAGSVCVRWYELGCAAL